MPGCGENEKSGTDFLDGDLILQKITETIRPHMGGCERNFQAKGQFGINPHHPEDENCTLQILMEDGGSGRGPVVILISRLGNNRFEARFPTTKTDTADGVAQMTLDWIKRLFITKEIWPKR